MTDIVTRRASLKTIAGIGVAGAALAMGASVATAGAAQAAQPLMADALRDLQAARAVLAAAAHDKAGHRLKALEFVDAAIVQVKAGMAAGAK